MEAKKEVEIVAAITLVEALRELLGAEDPKPKSDQITQPIRIVRVADSI